MRGFCLEEILSRGVYVQGDFVWKNILRGFCQEGNLSEGILSVSRISQIIFEIRSLQAILVEKQKSGTKLKSKKPLRKCMFVVIYSQP